MFAKQTNGWIGIDSGAQALKIAQLKQVGDRLQLTASAITPRWEGDIASPVERHRRELLSAKALAGTMQGKYTAAVLSMQSCTIQSGEQAEEVAQEINLCHDAWLSGGNAPYHLSIPQAEVVALCDGIVKTGLRCEVVDGQPLAVARSLRMTLGYEPQQLLGAFDWGASTATFVASRDGQALYVRKLKESGFNHVLDTVSSSLGISRQETEKEILRRGVAPGADDQLSVLFRDTVKQAIAPVVHELKRTLSHLGGKLKSKGPERVHLLGAGGAVPGLATLLSEGIGVSIEPWQAVSIGETEEGPPHCLIATALSLSALAWEVRS